MRSNKNQDVLSIGNIPHIIPTGWSKLFAEELKLSETSLSDIHRIRYKPAREGSTVSGEIWHIDSGTPTSSFTISSGYLSLHVVQGGLSVIKGGREMFVAQGTNISFTPGETSTIKATSQTLILARSENAQLALTTTPTENQTLSLPSTKATNEELNRVRLALGLEPLVAGPQHGRSYQPPQRRGPETLERSSRAWGTGFRIC